MKEKIAKLGTRVNILEKDVQLAGDQTLYTKYKEVLAEKEELSQKMLTRVSSLQSNQRSSELLH